MQAVRRYGSVRRFVHISSDEVYGDSRLEEDEVPKPESAMLTPTNTYSATKASCEAIIHAYAISFRIPVVTLRSPTLSLTKQAQYKHAYYFFIIKSQQFFCILGLHLDTSLNREQNFTE